MVATVSFPINSVHIPAGTTSSAFHDITAQLAGHAMYTVAADTSAWTTADHIAVLIEFRVDGGPIVAGCKINATGGTFINPNTLDPEFPSCSENLAHLPEFTTTLEARATVTVQSAGNLSGSISLT